MAIPSAGVITMLFVPNDKMPVVILSPVWVLTILVDETLCKYKKYPIQKKKWLLEWK